MVIADCIYGCICLDICAGRVRSHQPVFWKKDKEMKMKFTAAPWVLQSNLKPVCPNITLGMKPWRCTQRTLLVVVLDHAFNLVSCFWMLTSRKSFHWPFQVVSSHIRPCTVKCGWEVVLVLHMSKLTRAELPWRLSVCSFWLFFWLTFNLMDQTTGKNIN